MDTDGQLKTQGPIRNPVWMQSTYGNGRVEFTVEWARPLKRYPSTPWIRLHGMPARLGTGASPVSQERESLQLALIYIQY